MKLGKFLNIIILLLVVIILAFWGYYFYLKETQREVGTRIDIGQSGLVFPPLDSNFTFETIDNRDILLSASSKKMILDGFEGKILFLKIFGWDCQYCKKEIPELIHLKDELKDSLEIIAIEAQQHTKEESREYRKRYGINYIIVDGIKLQRFYEYLRVHYGWSGLIPVTIVLGKSGDILAYEVGVKSYTLAELIKASISKDKN
jgi:thiol-disulfide isomerase/thioredoxin